MSIVGLFAYGETGCTALKSLLKENIVKWVILPSDINSSKNVENLAKKNKITILRANSNKKIGDFISKNNVQVAIISSYNKILPEKTLRLTKFINIHHGDLPRWRGRANINWAIILGREDIGLTFHEASPDLDAGNIYYQCKVKITQKDTALTVYGKINMILDLKINKVIKKVLEGYIGEPQKGIATYCCTRLPEDGLIEWNDTSKNIYNLIRALTFPYPGAFSFLGTKKLIIWSAVIPTNPKVFEGRIPGRIISLHKKGVEVLTGDSSIIINEVTYSGKKGNASEFIKTVKKSLGLSILDLYAKISLENKIS